MVVMGRLTKKSQNDLLEAFQRWVEETKQGPAPTFAVVASVGVSTGEVKMKILDNKQFLKLDKYIRNILHV